MTEHYLWLSGFPTFLLSLEGGGGGIVKSCGELLAFISVPWWPGIVGMEGISGSGHQSSLPGRAFQTLKAALPPAFFNICSLISTPVPQVSLPR